MNPENSNPAYKQAAIAPEQAGRTYYPALDGLRGLAILLVVVYHNFGFINVFFFGWLGVDLFFVLSGFLITDILLKTVGKKDYLRNFYIRRMLRIFPLYYLCLILFLIVLPKTNLQFDVQYYIDHQVWLWTYLQNWIYTFQNPGQTNTLNHLWSLAVEEQFYLLWPLAVLVIKNPKYLLLFISLILVAVLGLRLWAWMHQVVDLAYFNLFTFTRIDGICIGCMIALLQRVNPNFLKRYTSAIVLFFAFMNFAFFFVNRRYHFAFPYLALAGYTTFAMMFGLLVNEVVTNKTKLVNFLFNIPLLKFFGKISYGFYIFHWPVYILLSPYLFPWVSKFVNGSSLEFSVSVLATLAAIGISWISYQYFEKYFLKLKDKFA
ncbi:MAG: acyltransferase [Bacteroidota bacterium]|nr:acyltransferase [Bacteroidota bacterium]